MINFRKQGVWLSIYTAILLVIVFPTIPIDNVFATDTGNTVDGNIYINNTTVWYGTITLNGNVTINKTGILILDNVDLQVNNSYRIILNGGNLSVVNNSVIRCNVSGYGGYARIENSTLSNISLDDNTIVDMINTTYINITFIDNKSLIRRYWYLTVKVLWNNSIPVKNAVVRVINNLSSEIFNESTDTDGVSDNIMIKVYEENISAKYYLSPFTIITIKSKSITNITLPNITENTVIDLFFDNNCPLGEFYTMPEEYEMFTEEESVVFIANITDIDNDTITYTWSLDDKLIGNGTIENTTKGNEINITIGNDYNLTSIYNDYNKSHVLCLQFTDGNATREYLWKFNITNINRAPIINEISPTINPWLGEYSHVTFRVNVTDIDNDNLYYLWIVDGELQGSITEPEYTFYTANRTGIHIIELNITDSAPQPRSIFYNWTVNVINISKLYNQLLNQTELMNKIDEMNLTISKLEEEINCSIKNISSLQKILKNVNITNTNLTENLTKIWNRLNITLLNLSAKWNELNETKTELDTAIDEKNKALDEKNKAIDERKRAEMKLSGSVLVSAICGMIAGMIVSMILFGKYKLIFRLKKGKK